MYNYGCVAVVALFVVTGLLMIGGASLSKCEKNKHTIIMSHILLAPLFNQ